MLSFSPESALYNPATGDWLIDEIAAGESESLQITARILENGSYVNTASLISSFPVDDNEDNNIDTANVTVGKKTKADCGVLFNMFSPNSDGLNDFFSD